MPCPPSSGPILSPHRTAWSSPSWIRFQAVSGSPPVYRTSIKTLTAVIHDSSGDETGWYTDLPACCDLCEASVRDVLRSWSRKNPRTIGRKCPGWPLNSAKRRCPLGVSSLMRFDLQRKGFDCTQTAVSNRSVWSIVSMNCSTC